MKNNPHYSGMNRPSISSHIVRAWLPASAIVAPLVTGLEVTAAGASGCTDVATSNNAANITNGTDQVRTRRMAFSEGTSISILRARKIAVNHLSTGGK